MYVRITILTIISAPGVLLVELLVVGVVLRVVAAVETSLLPAPGMQNNKNLGLTLSQITHIYLYIYISIYMYMYIYIYIYR